MDEIFSTYLFYDEEFESEFRFYWKSTWNFNEIREVSIGLTLYQQVSRKSQKRVFCSKTGHKPQDCVEFSNVQRAAIWKNSNRCFLCFRVGHIVRNCSIVSIVRQEAEAAWKLTSIKKNLTCESNFWIDFRTMVANYYGDNTIVLISLAFNSNRSYKWGFDFTPTSTQLAEESTALTVLSIRTICHDFLYIVPRVSLSRTKLQCRVRHFTPTYVMTNELQEVISIRILRMRITSRIMNFYWSHAIPLKKTVQWTFL